MKRLLRAAWISLLMLLPLCGCALSPVERHAAAIEQAVLSFTDCYFELDGLRAQLKAQAGSQTGYEQTAEYTLAIRVPDYSRIPASDVRFTRPKPSFAAMDRAGFAQSLASAAYEGVRVYAAAHSFPATLDATLDVRLSKANGEWTAAFTPESRALLMQTLDAMLREKAEQLCADAPEYRLFDVAEQKTHLLGLAFEGEGFARASVIYDVRALGDDRFAVDIGYPDPNEAFALLADRMFDSYVEHIFKAPNLRLTGDLGDTDALRALPALQATLTVYCVPGGTAALEDDAGLWNAFYKAKLAEESELNARVCKEWLVSPQPRPATGVLLGESKGNDFVFDGAGMERDVYLLFCSLEEGETIYSEGTPYLTAYLRRDSKLSFRLPTGNYKMIEVYGTTWYGQRYQFGDENDIYLFQEELLSRDGYTFYLTFHAEDGGNVSSAPMN